MRWVNPKFLRVVFARRINNVNVTEAVVLLVGVAKVAVRINAKFTADLFVRSDVVVIFFFLAECGVAGQRTRALDPPLPSTGIFIEFFAL